MRTVKDYWLEYRQKVVKPTCIDEDLNAEATFMAGSLSTFGLLRGLTEDPDLTNPERSEIIHREYGAVNARIMELVQRLREIEENEEKHTDQ